MIFAELLDSSAKSEQKIQKSGLLLAAGPIGSTYGSIYQTLDRECFWHTKGRMQKTYPALTG